MNTEQTATSGQQPETNEKPEAKKHTTWRDFFSLGEVGGYFFRGKDDRRPTNINIRMMHGVNKISIAVFLVAVVYLVLRHLL